jgi:hypothetical protein
LVLLFFCTALLAKTPRGEHWPAGMYSSRDFVQDLEQRLMITSRNNISTTTHASLAELY